MGTSSQRNEFIKQTTCIVDDFLATDRIERTATGCAAFFTDGICTIQGILEADPTGIDCIQGITCIGQRYNKLRTTLG